MKELFLSLLLILFAVYSISDNKLGKECDPEYKVFNEIKLTRGNYAKF